MPARPPSRDDESGGPDATGRRLETTMDLLRLAREGDREALDRLCRRLSGPLHRWASGRLPRWARDLLDTNDLVQETLIKTIRNIGKFEPRREGALQVYLRKALQNRIREEIRRVGRKPAASALDEGRAADNASPLEEAIGRQAAEAYDKALDRLRDREREAIVARIELGMSYADVALALGKPTADAARMAVSRALVRLAEEMKHER